MMNILSLIILAVAVSLDSLMVSFGYGLKKLRLPANVVVWIGICSGVIFGLSMMLGQLLTLVLTEQFTRYLGAACLFGLGCYSFFTFDQPEPKRQVQRKYRFELKSIGLVIEILKQPSLADLDHSGHISGVETFWLALALSIDAVAAGMGASLAGVSLWASVVISVTTMLFLTLGIRLGEKCAIKALPSLIRYLPGLLLIMLAISRLIF
ncbi:putative sporulation protein YtaF [Amphibacillus marinus]|uniref:Putative sporulation protein YtaF n=1 Tax=Amphibacillus marinus TaxID=872970 RepID=A0A1H8STK8_9BACI|nr:sporulation membrane protein YtaF [Amphibacillus marinus]SEO82309.1 putative sporulation protein YtaF [Amphibacillus marinus]